MNLNQHRKNKRKSGAVLLMVMCLIMMLSFLLSAFLKNVMRDVYMRSQMFGTATLRQQAYNVLDATIAILTEMKAMESELYSPLQGWQNPIEFAKLKLPEEFVITLKVSDETGKIPLSSKLDGKTIEALMTEIGLDSIDASRAAKGFIKWSERKDTPITIFVENKKIANKQQPKENNKQKQNNPKQQNQPKQEEKNTNVIPSGLKSYQQLAEIENIKKIFFDKQGVGTEKLDMFVKNTSIYSDGPININTVNKEVLAILSKQFPVDKEQIERFLGLEKTEGSAPKFYKSLEEISKKGHGRFTVATKPQNNNQKEDKDNKQKPKEQNTQQSETKAMVGVVAKILKVDIKVQKADISYYLTAILKNNSQANEQQNADKKQNNKNSQNDNLTKQPQSAYNSIRSIELVSISEGGLLL